MSIEKTISEIRRLSFDSNTGVRLVTLEDVLIELKKLEEELNKTTISWGVDDFESRAIEKEEWKSENDEIPTLYDRSKFQENLERMIHEHDCNVGISWDTIDVYLETYCKL